MSIVLVLVAPLTLHRLCYGQTSLCSSSVIYLWISAITGLEEQFEKRKFPHGKVTVDGFICVVDASRSQQRTLESQLEFVNKILLCLVKTKKPVVVVATKMDEGSDAILNVIFIV